MCESLAKARALAKLGEEPQVTEQVQHDVKQFVCTLYGYPDQVNVIIIRHMMFQEKYAPNEGDDPFSKKQRSQSKYYATMPTIPLEQDQKSKFCSIYVEEGLRMLFNHIQSC